jgi:PhnB protein
MTAQWKPEGYTSLSPYLIVSNAQAVIDFATEVFAATELRRYDRPDGSIMHCEFRIDDTVIMLGDAGNEWSASPAHLHVYVKDVNDTYQRAILAGGLSLQVPGQKKGDPDRRGGVKDPSGNSWLIATQAQI